MKRDVVLTIELPASGGKLETYSVREPRRCAGYRGLHEVEIFSARDWWRRDPDEVLAVCKGRFLKAT